MKKPVEEWQIQKRFFLSRELSNKRDVPRERPGHLSGTGGPLSWNAKNSNPALTLKLGAEAGG